MPPPTKESIIKAIRDAVEPLPHVHAMWEGGAIAFGRVDKWSDIDLYVDTDDAKAEEVLKASEAALRKLSPIERRFDPPPPPHGGYVQSFFLLEGTGPYLLVDLAIVRHGGKEKFLVPEIHGNVIFHFNKKGIIKVPHIDRAALDATLRERVAKLKARADMFWPFFDKWANRGDHIQALDFYNRVILGSLVEALRIKHMPARHDFGTYYIRYDLPPDVVKRLEKLYFVKDMDDMMKKRRLAGDWFRETMDGLGAM